MFTPIRKIVLLGTNKSFFWDFRNLPDGAMPGGWSGANVTITSGRLVITPTLSGELLTDPGLEGNYTAGKCDAVGKTGTPTYAQSADVHGGAKAQEMTADAQDELLTHYILSPTKWRWYKTSIWAKRVAGTSGTACTLNLYLRPLRYWPDYIISAVYKNFLRTGHCPDDDYLQLAVKDIGTSAFDTVVFDDDSMKSITLSTMMPVLPSLGGINSNVSAGWEIAEGCCAGVVAKANSLTNPTNFLLAVHDGQIAYGLYKCVAGVYTELFRVMLPYSIGAKIEIRTNGTTVQAFYNGRQVGTNQTVTDTGIINNNLCAPFSSDPLNKCTDFTIMPYWVRGNQSETWRPASDRYSGQELVYTRQLMLSGDTLQLDGGTYTPLLGVNFTLIPNGTSAHHTRIIGNGSILTGNNQLLLQNQSWIDVDNLIIRDTTGYGIHLISCTDMTFTGCTIDHPTGGTAFEDTCIAVASQRIYFVSCTAGPSLSTTGSCDGFEFDDGCSDSYCVNCVAHGLQNGAGENDGHGFEVFNSGLGSECSNITFTNCEAYDTRIGFSNESSGTGGDNPGVICDYCNNHTNTFHDYQGLNSATLLVRHHIGDVSTTGNVTVES